MTKPCRLPHLRRAAGHRFRERQTDGTSGGQSYGHIHKQQGTHTGTQTEEAWAAEEEGDMSANKGANMLRGPR